jgi:succinylarginine dihydrolase
MKTPSIARSIEVNFDSLVGNTHHYGGLSYGNMASLKHKHRIANPKMAALQGLNKMHELMLLGVPQAILPPHYRPNITFLRQLGFLGTNEEILRSAYTHQIELLSAAYSASAMWAANAATVSPSTDTADGKVHFTPANLISYLHRSLETEFTQKLLKKIFKSSAHFCIQSPLLAQKTFSDEGAANHARFFSPQTNIGVHLFVYGKSAFDETRTSHRFPARQTLDASMAIARRHGLDTHHVVFAQQNPVAIDLGVFHNDVISVNHEHVFLYHEKAFLNTTQVIRQLQEALDESLCPIQIADSELSLTEAVNSYLFNSQIVTLPNKKMALIAPVEARDSQYAQNVIDRILDYDNPIEKVVFVDCRQSMQNGGGPACLRLRVPLTEIELSHVHPGVLLDEPKYAQLVDWVNKHYRDRLSIEDLVDPKLVTETETALDALTKILALPGLYPFQA